MELDFEGATVARTAFHRSLIRSDARLDYPRVDRVFAGSERAEDPWAGPLAAAREVAAALDAARAARGALAIESVEPEFDFSHEGHVTALEASAQTESHRLIEHLMIAANEAVAGFLESHKLPALYRVHERPEPKRVEHVVEQLAALGVPTPPLPATMTPQQAGELLGEISRLVDAHVRRTGRGRQALTSLVLRSLKQAHYAARNLGHHGLQSPRYCHFTSPIRRYPDLICHRALLAGIGAGEDAPAASAVQGAGEWCSLRERDAAQIERTADDVARAFLLEGQLFRGGWETEWRGEVIGVIGAGAFVAFGEGYEGLLPVRRLRGDWWELDPLQVMLTGSQSGKAIRLGDPVTVQVVRVDAPRGRADLSPVEFGPATRAMPDIATNKQAAYRYHLLERWEAGLVLTGTEVKSLRGGKAQLKDGYASVQNGEVWLHNVHIPPYGPATRENHEPERPRKLLLHKREIERLIGKTREKGLTIVPTRLYFKGPRAKVEVALARGKDVGDKRQTIKEREMKREMERAIRHR